MIKKKWTRELDCKKAFFKYSLYRFGTNIQKLRKIKNAFELILEVFEDYFLRIILIAGICSFVIGVLHNGWETGWIESGTILITLVIIVTVTASNNYVKEKQFQKLFQKANDDYIVVYRGRTGMPKTIPFTELLVGDVI
jgi:magnesium-transporting ATPase (P-type)